MNITTIAKSICSGMVKVKTIEKRFNLEDIYKNIVENSFNECLLTSIQLNIIHHRMFKRYLTTEDVQSLIVNRIEHCFLKYSNCKLYEVKRIWNLYYSINPPQEYLENLTTRKVFLNSYENMTLDQIYILMSDF
jgi:hypothetical protein